MRITKCLITVVALAGVGLGSAAHLRADQPIGLAAMEQFESISGLRHGARTYQASSYDRTGANNDRGNYLYVDGNEKVMLDVKGPGCIYRIWATGLIGGRLRFYFDGETTPRIDMKPGDFFSGTNAPFLSPLVGNDTVSSGGNYCYLPMPFREGCKIVVTDIDIYYHVTYQRFASADGVTTFTGTADSTAVRNMWNNAGSDPKPDQGDTVLSDTVSLSPGNSVTMADLTSAGVIQRVELNIPGLSPGSPWDERLLGLRLKAYWDGETQPSVDAPVADFFGSGLGAATVNGLPVGMDGSRLYCYFPMPFGNRAELQLHNDGFTTISNLTYTVRYDPLAGPPAGTGRFHAQFLSETPTTNGRDYLILDETGAGHLVGVVQTMKANGTQPVYLEGDERIHVDGSLTPALYGTGTEDFYNGGWYFATGPFTLPVHGAPRRVTTSPLADTCYRFLLSDTIPFTTALHVGIEHGPVNDVVTDIRSVAFYYKTSQPLSTLTDELDVGDAGSEAGHSYVPDGLVWQGSFTSTYEGDDDTVGVIDDGRRSTGGSQFQVSIDPSNNGVLLRRRMDYSYANQEAEVLVDGQSAGIWYTAGDNVNSKWRDDEFMIPPVLTQGKSTLDITIQNTSTTSDWTEFHYWVFSFLSQGPFIQCNPAALEPVARFTLNAPAETFTVANGGDQTLNYLITDDASWLSVQPENGASAGEADTIQVDYDTDGLAVGTYDAEITVTDPSALNSPFVLPVTLTVEPIPGDFDGDSDVDQANFGHLQACLSGNGIPPADERCDDADLDRDKDVDADDYVIFAGCSSGANISADPGCAE